MLLGGGMGWMKFKIVAYGKLLGRGGKDFYILYTLMLEMAVEYDFD